MGQHFQLHDGEYEQSATKETLVDYEAVCTPDTITLPVNRLLSIADGRLFICFADTALRPELYANMLRARVGYSSIEMRDSTIGGEKWTGLSFKYKQFTVVDAWKPSKAAGMCEVFCFMGTDSTKMKSHFSDFHALSLRISH